MGNGVSINTRHKGDTMRRIIIKQLNGVVTFTLPDGKEYKTTNLETAFIRLKEWDKHLRDRKENNVCI